MLGKLSRRIFVVQHFVVDSEPVVLSRKGGGRGVRWYEEPFLDGW